MWKLLKKGIRLIVHLSLESLLIIKDTLESINEDNIGVIRTRKVLNNNLQNDIDTITIPLCNWHPVLLCSPDHLCGLSSSYCCCNPLWHQRYYETGNKSMCHFLTTDTSFAKLNLQTCSISQPTQSCGFIGTAVLSNHSGQSQTTRRTVNQ